MQFAKITPGVSCCSFLIRSKINEITQFEINSN